MRIALSREDKDRFASLDGIRKMNFDVLSMYASLLNNAPCTVSGDMIDELVSECDVTRAEAYGAVLSAVFGLETETNAYDNNLEQLYILPSVRELKAEDYLSDDYFKNIRIPEGKHGRWEYKYEAYEPYEAFVCRDIEVKNDFREIPSIGFFAEKFSFPAVFENGIEWMAVKPNEIETMRLPIANAHGDVVTFGLGLGYFAYMASNKTDVKTVTVVERDKNAIDLFTKHILPQFANKDKIIIVNDDAFDYVQTVMPKMRYNYAFVDIWHDVSDGFELYLRMKRLEKLSPRTEFEYWIEKSLLSHLRWIIFDNMKDVISDKIPSGDGELIASYDKLISFLDDDSLRSLAPKLKKVEA